MTNEQQFKWVGKPVRRKEDPRLLTGRGRYTADIEIPGTKHVAFVRSVHAHARIVGIDSSRALALPGVVAVLTGAEVRAKTKPMLGTHYFPQVPGEAKFPEFWALASDKVNYVGEAVAAVLADSRYLAEDAAEAVEVEYELLPPLVDAEAALQPDAPLIHEAWGDNVAWHMVAPGGDTQTAFESADRVYKERFRCQRKVAVALEPRSSLAQYDPARKVLTVWSANQRPFTMRDQLVDLLNLPPGSVHVIAPADMGGGFGSKANMYPEDLVVALLALETGRPVRWVEDRREHFLACGHDSEQIHDIEFAVAADGKVLGVRDRIVSDAGAATNAIYSGGAIQLMVATAVMPNTYDIPNFDWEAHAVATNKSPHGGARGFGQIPGRFAVERMMDIIAKDLGLDPAEIRRRNMVTSFPHQTVTYMLYDTGSFTECLEQALELIGYDTFREEQRAALAEGRYVGVGLASVVEIGAPNSYLMAGLQMSGYASATVSIDATGRVCVFSGEAPHGQSHETTFAQVAAEQLGVTPDEVAVTTGDTALAPYCTGTYGNRSAPLTCSAIYQAAGDVREKVLRIGAHLLEVAVDDLELDGGKVSAKGAPAKALTLGEIAYTAYNAPLRLPPETEPGLEMTKYFDIQAPLTLGNGCEAVKVEVDPETGQVRILKYVVVHDCGRVLNPMVVDGQLHGQVCHEIGYALHEALVYDEGGQLLTTTLLDYLLPTAEEVPDVDVASFESPSTLTTLGAKGMGEGTVAVASIANAVEDALTPFGVKITELPMSPDRVLALISGARA
ncbi:MAG: xanthine dehydrogenase family protein molybdopterin-binding subunit [Thermoleophilia bacterium]|nr:xanthine dehydrogenase family protein molybdopterin-binding subunit [Thermoleophilia bacterium]